MNAISKALFLVAAIAASVGCEEANGPSNSEDTQVTREPSVVHSSDSVVSMFSSSQVEAGRALHIRILDKHPHIDAYYRRASLWGALTNQPLVVIWIPVADWQALSEEERDSLGAYSASFVDAVRASPLEYSDIPPSAPAAPAIMKRAAAMTAESWGIGIGAVSDDGKDILADDVLLRGQQ